MSKNRSKRFKQAVSLVEQEAYTLAEACALLPKTSTTKFDGSVEMHIHLGVDPKHADQIIRFTISLPNGTGKTYKVIAFVPDEMIPAAKAAGAMEAGVEELITKITGGWMDFDIAVAHPSVMKNLGKIAKQLGQARKMPSPKAGTVSENIEQTVQDIMKGQIEVRTDKFGVVHNLIGKVSFGSEKIQQNAETLIKAINENKPSGAKGTYIKSVSLTTTMGPGLNIDLTVEKK
jgi:large subunit ribosomal protein L1